MMIYFNPLSIIEGLIKKAISHINIENILDAFISYTLYLLPSPFILSIHLISIHLNIKRINLSIRSVMDGLMDRRTEDKLSVDPTSDFSCI